MRNLSILVWHVDCVKPLSIANPRVKVTRSDERGPGLILINNLNNIVLKKNF
jgi:hypothetical protein